MQSFLFYLLSFAATGVLFYITLHDIKHTVYFRIAVEHLILYGLAAAHITRIAAAVHIVPWKIISVLTATTVACIWFAEAHAVPKDLLGGSLLTLLILLTVGLGCVVWAALSLPGQRV